MKLKFPFRGFVDSELQISSYPSGIKRFDLVCDDKWLGELSVDYISELEGCVYFKCTKYAEEILRSMMGLDLVDFFAGCTVDEKPLFVVGLSSVLLRGLGDNTNREALAF